MKRHIAASRPASRSGSRRSLRRRSSRSPRSRSATSRRCTGRCRSTSPSRRAGTRELGLKPVFSTFPAGVPQIAASASKSWDVGGTGSVPATLGAVRYNLLTIGITNDESYGNALLATAKTADGFMKNPASIKGQTIVLTANSTGDYAVQSCLAKWGLKKSDVTMKSMGQAEIISAMSSGNADLGGLWAPNTYTMEEKAGAKQICSGQDAGAAVPGALIVRADYAKEQPQNVAKFLAVYLRAWKWMNAHQPEGDRDDEEVLRAGRRDDQRGVDEEGVHDAPDVRPRRPAEDHEAAAGGASEVDGWFTKIGAFMQANGTFPEAPAASKFVTDEYMRMVDADPKLKAFANRAD